MASSLPCLPYNWHKGRQAVGLMFPELCSTVIAAPAPRLSLAGDGAGLAVPWRNAGGLNGSKENPQPQSRKANARDRSLGCSVLRTVTCASWYVEFSPCYVLCGGGGAGPRYLAIIQTGRGSRRVERKRFPALKYWCWGHLGGFVG